MSVKYQLLGGGGPSPFVRKVLIAARELGLYERLEGIKTSVTPMTVNEKVNAANPLGKVPTLVVTGPDGGTKTYFDSTVIVQFLDSINEERKILPPASSSARYDALTIEALADGILEAALLARYEGMREPQLQNADWLGGQHAKIRRGIVHLASINLPDPVLEGPFPAHGIAAACSLWYMGRRFPEIDWTKWEGGEKLNVWYGLVAQRASWIAEKVD